MAAASRQGRQQGTRTSIVHHRIHGQSAIREAGWRLVFCHGSGGWSKPRDAEAREQGLPAVQPDDLAADIGETLNR